MVEGLVVVDSNAPFPGLVVFVNVDLSEERLVEEPSRVVIGLHVCTVAVPGQIQGVR